jgi:hypothetical protein
VILTAMMTASGKQLKFTSNSAGGFNAVRCVMRAWRKGRDAHPASSR